MERCSVGWMLTLKRFARAHFILLVLGAKVKPNLKVWGAFQNPLVPDCSIKLVFKNLVGLVLGTMLKHKVQVMGAWENPWYLVKVKRALLKPLVFIVLA